jgi:hypothetical protein
MYGDRSCAGGWRNPIIQFVFVTLLLGFGGCNRQPYSTVRVSGKVTYSDGSLIPANRIHIKFVPLADPLNPATHPRAGQAEVDTATGEFASVTSQTLNDGIIAGDHKVLIIAIVNNQVADDLVPAIYCRESTTPLQVNSSQSPFEFKIPKPAAR